MKTASYSSLPPHRTARSAKILRIGDQCIGLVLGDKGTGFIRAYSRAKELVHSVRVNYALCSIRITIGDLGPVFKGQKHEA